MKVELPVAGPAPRGLRTPHPPTAPSAGALAELAYGLPGPRAGVFTHRRTFEQDPPFSYLLLS